MSPKKRITPNEVFKVVGAESRREQSIVIDTISYLLTLLSQEEAGTKLNFGIFEIHKIDEGTFIVIHIPTNILMEETIVHLADEGWIKE